MRTHWLAALALFVLALPAAAQIFIPIPVTGFNQDVIADAGGTAQATTTAGFDGSASAGDVYYVLYQQGFNTTQPTAGLPANGLIVPGATRSYQMGPITGNNSLQLNSSNPNGTLTLPTPADYSQLSVLLADGNGTRTSPGALGNLLVNWSNGNTTTTNFVVFDWFPLTSVSAPSGIAINVMTRVLRNSGTFDNSGAGPVLFYYDIDLSGDPNQLAGALVDSVAFSWPGLQTVGGEITNIMGLSGIPSVPEPSTFALVGAAGCLAFRRFATRWTLFRIRKPMNAGSADYRREGRLLSAKICEICG
jgi:hypothetical protein